MLTEGLRGRLVLDHGLVDPRLDMADHAHLERGRVSVDDAGQVLQLESGTCGLHRSPDTDGGRLLPGGHELEATRVSVPAGGERASSVDVVLIEEDYGHGSPS